MTYYDVFNGDADGICSLIQWRKCFPIEQSEQILVTGVKRDIQLVQQVNPKIKSSIAIFDISFDKNVEDVKRLLDDYHRIDYFDHHKADNLFEHPLLQATINLAATTCTALLVSEHCSRTHHLWAIAAAFGDGLDSVAIEQSESLDLSKEEMSLLKEFGVLINYNGYGSSTADLCVHPADLYKNLSQYETPLNAWNDPLSAIHKLKKRYKQDLAKAEQSTPILSSESVIAIKLEDAAWSRRISGTFGNILAANNENKAIVIVTDNSYGSYTISLRAPRTQQHSAADICSQFPTGGGRAGAAGVNELPKQQLNVFLQAVEACY